MKIDTEKIRMSLHIMQIKEIKSRLILKKKNSEPLIGWVKILKFELDKDDYLVNFLLTDNTTTELWIKNIKEVDRADKL